jgi:uncharacterized membrane protein YGL010W
MWTKLLCRYTLLHRNKDNNKLHFLGTPLHCLALGPIMLLRRSCYRINDRFDLNIMFTFYCRKKKNAIYCCPYFCGGEYIDTIISFTCFFVMLRKQPTVKPIHNNQIIHILVHCNFTMIHLNAFIHKYQQRTELNPFWVNFNVQFTLRWQWRNTKQILH